MTDDPREILKAAGAECAELDTFLCERGPSEWEDDDELDTAFLALARLVAKYKWQRDAAMDRGDPGTGSHAEYLADLDRRWDWHFARPDA